MFHSKIPQNLTHRKDSSKPPGSAKSHRLSGSASQISPKAQTVALPLHHEGIIDPFIIPTTTIPPPPMRKSGSAFVRQSSVTTSRRSSFAQSLNLPPPPSQNLTQRRSSISKNLALYAKRQCGVRAVSQLTQVFNTLRDIAAKVKKFDRFNVTSDVLKDWSDDIVRAVEGGVDALKGNEDALGEVLTPVPHDVKKPKPGGLPLELNQSDFSRAETTAFHFQTARLPSPQGALASQTPHLLISAVYLAIESVYQQLRAERCILYIAPLNGLDELRAMTTCGTPMQRGEDRITNLLAHPAGVCFKTQVLLNCSDGVKVNDVMSYLPPSGTEERRAMDRIWSSLSMYIPGAPGMRKPYGALHLINKNGQMNFDPDDENILYGCVHLISGLLQRSPCHEITRVCFDFSFLGDTGLVSLPPRQDSSATIAPRIMNAKKQYVFRTAGSQKGISLYDQAQKCDMPLTENSSVVEIGDYTARLSENWKNAVMLNMEYQKYTSTLEKQIQTLREDFGKEKMRSRALMRERMEEGPDGIVSKEWYGRDEERNRLFHEEFKHEIQQRKIEEEAKKAKAEEEPPVSLPLFPYPTVPPPSAPHRPSTTSHRTGGLLKGVPTDVAGGVAPLDHQEEEALGYGTGEESGEDCE